MNHTSDRNFDDIADHFAHKVYGGLKGQIRLAVLQRDLINRIENLHQQKKRPLKILDVGAGLAQISIDLALMGHDITLNDISGNMLAKAKEHFYNITNESDRESINIHWIISPYQELNDKLPSHEKYDVILCHAVLEWLANPSHFIEFSQNWISDNGLLSLCFYNPASFVYRNLIMGNFNLLNNPDYQADTKKSLTPNNPVAKDDLISWLVAADMEIDKISGLRVFYDYTTHKRGGLSCDQDIIEMEVRYSDQEPYKWMGRYLHVLAMKKKN